MSIFTERLKETRIKSGKTQREICANIGIHQQTWVKYEKGISSMTVETLTKICKELNVSADWLLGLTD